MKEAREQLYMQKPEIASEFLNQWLGKYGSIEEIQQLVKRMLVTHILQKAFFKQAMVTV